MRKMLEQCPTCEGHRLIVTEVHCADCGTTVRSAYRPTVFERLSAENLRFVEIFVRNRGNVKEMERELGVSYWAIRNRLDEIITLLALEPTPPPAPAADRPTGDDARAQAQARQAVLNELQAGAISVQEAAARLQKLTG